MKEGIGSYSIKLPNGLAEDGKIIAGIMDNEKKNMLNSYELMKNGVNKVGFSIDNTIIGIVATNVKLDKA